MDNVHAVIMAGGVGSRFWPKSRKALPKQFLSLFGKETLIQSVGNRILPLIPAERIWIVTTREQSHYIQQQLEWVRGTNILYEPVGKNTAPALGLAALHIHQHDPDALMIVLPSDHLIMYPEKFLNIIERGVSLVREHRNSLATIGIDPTYPATGYGYIQRGEKISGPENGVYTVRAFAEKPTPEIARQFFENGEFLWNSGIFIWHTETILNYIEELMPDLYHALIEIKKSFAGGSVDEVTDKVYRQIKNVSIDYGVMERASQVLVIEGQFGWSDVGSWEEVYNLSPKDEQGNVLKGPVLAKTCQNIYVEADDRIIALVGVDDLVVVDTHDALLICNRHKTQDVKWLVEKLKRENKKNIL